MAHLNKLAAFVAPIALAACAAQPPLASVPDNLKPAGGETLTMVVPAKGVQIYECRAKKGESGFEWAFVAPDAELFDTRGNRIGKHYAGPHWEASDGSKVIGAMKERADAPAPDTIPWLLLTAKSVGPAGSFEKVTNIQRVNTVGGVAPKDGCSQANAGRQARVSYTADYYFFNGR